MKTKIELSRFQIHLGELFLATADVLEKLSDEKCYAIELGFLKQYRGDLNSNPSSMLEAVRQSCETIVSRASNKHASGLGAELLTRANILEGWNWEIRNRKTLSEGDVLRALDESRVHDTEGFHTLMPM